MQRKDEVRLVNTFEQDSPYIHLMATRPVNALVTAFRVLMREKGFRKHRSWYYKDHDGILLCFHLQRSRFDAVYFLNAGLTDRSLLTNDVFPVDTSAWHACGRSESIMKHLTGTNENSTYSETTSVEVLSNQVDVITGFLAHAATALRNSSERDFPLELLWIQQCTRAEMFSPRW